MKIYKYLALVLFVSSLGLVSCGEDEVDLSTVTRFQSFDILGLPDSVEMSEGDDPMEFNFTFDDNQIFDLTIELSSGEGSSAVDGSDFSLSSHSIDVATLAKSGSFTFSALSDLETEGDETVFLTVSSGSVTEYPNTHVIEIVIKDVLDTRTFVTVDWDGTFLFDGDSYTWCQFVDMDVLLQDATGQDLGIYPAATGACPETIESTDITDDGEYFMAGYLYALGPLNGLGITDSIPITINVFKQDVYDVSYTPEDVFRATDGDQAADGNNEFKDLGRIVVTGGQFDVYDHNGVLLTQ